MTSVKVVYKRVNTSSWQTVDGGWQCLVVYVCAHACARTVCVRNRELCLHPAATRQSSKVNSLFLACAQFMMCFPLHIELKPVDRNSYLMSSTFFSGGIFFFVVFWYSVLKVIMGAQNNCSEVILRKGPCVFKEKNNCFQRTFVSSEDRLLCISQCLFVAPKVILETLELFPFWLLLEMCQVFWPLLQKSQVSHIMLIQW